jgi:hypothetical protein
MTMGCEVYANGDEIACKAGSGKVIASFPDVCLTPPPPPAGPIPVPYPDTSFSKDMQQGTKTVMISGQEVMMKDQSFYKTSPLGDEAATNGQGANVITHVITGKTYFILWSMDVKFEDANVDRHTDMTTSNHACPPAGDPTPNGNMSKPSPSAAADKKKCAKLRNEINKKNKALGKELRKYDPAKDAKGGHTIPRSGGKKTKPCGHYIEMRQLQKGMRNDLKKFNEECRDSGIKIDKRVNDQANREIAVPPGCNRIPITTR